MPSITCWSRIEPRPRARSIAEGLAAPVRDPLWMFTRQWQFQESHGEDAGSPAFAQVVARLGPLRSWAARSGDMQPLHAGTPLEPTTLAEGFSQTDLSLAVELGQVFEQALVDRERDDLVDAFRQAYSLHKRETELDDRDREALRFLQVVDGRGTDGVELHLAAESASPNLPEKPPIAEDDEGVVWDALERLRTWVSETVGRIGQSHARAWDPERLEYDLKVVGQSPAGGQVELSASPDRDARFEWYAFDVQRHSSAGDEAEEGIETIRRSVIPANVTFRGMPNSRWWAFESGAVNFGAIRPERRELAKLAVLDFVLVHGNDWYLLPLRLPPGTLCSIESLVVHDVFGGKTLIERADRGPVGPAGIWTMFSTSIAGKPDVDEFFLLPPTVGAAAQSGEIIEEVRFVRDEMANLAWAIERTVENAIGEPWPAHERSVARTETDSSAAISAEDEPPLRYKIQTSVPEHWIPFPPVAIDASLREVRFERGVFLRSASEGATPPAPVGRILQPVDFPEDRYQLHEEAISRVGVGVLRVVNRSRWVDGSTHVWIARRKLSGTGEQHSQLSHDVAVTTAK